MNNTFKGHVIAHDHQGRDLLLLHNGEGSGCEFASCNGFGILGHALGRGEIENILAGFVDHNELDPASKATFAKAVKLGIIQGINTKELRPKLPASRAQAAVMVRRYLSVVGVF